MNKKGISLGEVFTVVIIIIVLGSILSIGYFKKKNDRSTGFCTINMKAIKTVIELYNSENSAKNIMFHPGMGVLKDTHLDSIKNYFLGNRFPVCPAGGNYGINDDCDLYCTVHPENIIPLELARPQDQKKDETVKPVVKTTDKMIALTQDEQYFQNGKKLLQEKNYVQAAHFFEKAYETCPEKEYYLFSVSDAYFRAEDFTSARQCLNPILKTRKAQEMAKVISKYEYFKTRLNSYETSNVLFHSLNTYGKQDTISQTNLLGRSENVLAKDLYLCGFTISPRDKIMYFSHSDLVQKFDLTTGKIDDLYTNSGLLIYSLQSSGNKLIFLSPKVNRNYQLILLDLNTRIAGGITPEKISVNRAYFSNNGFYIYYLAQDSIYRYNIATKQTSVCWEHPTLRLFDFCMHPTKDEACVVASGVSGPGKDLILISLDETEKYSPVTSTSDISETFPMYSPQAGYISYFSKNDKIDNIYLYDLVNKCTLALTDFNDENSTLFPAVCWFPDEQFLYFSYGEDGVHSLYIIEISTKKQLEILEKSSDIGTIKMISSSKKDILPQNQKSDLKMFH